MQQFESAEGGVKVFAGCRYLDAEFMYRSRPNESRQRLVFDYTLASRLSKLGHGDGVLFICEGEATIESLSHLEAEFPQVTMGAIITNPRPWDGETPDTPRLLNWDRPDDWRRYQTTDRWARIKLALEVASRVNSSGYLVIPAQDAVWGDGLLARLAWFSRRHTRGGLPAAVSPYTYHQHSSIPGADIPVEIINTLNTAFGRDVMFRWKLALGRIQGFWGKMGMIPSGMCGAIGDMADDFVWEDDLEIDRVIRDLGYAARATWVSSPVVYRQAPPVFDHDGLKRVIERNLHYSLNIPGQVIGTSALNFPLGVLGQMRRLNPRFAHYHALAEAVTAECMVGIRARLEQSGASWVDWGAYRHVIRVGEAAVEVWKRPGILV